MSVRPVLFVYKEVVAGDLDTGLLDRTMDDYAPTPPPPATPAAR